MYPVPSNPQRRPDFGPGCLIAGALASSWLAGTAPRNPPAPGSEARPARPFAKLIQPYSYFFAISNSTANRSESRPVFTASSDSTQNST